MNEKKIQCEWHHILRKFKYCDNVSAKTLSQYLNCPKQNSIAYFGRWWYSLSFLEVFSELILSLTNKYQETHFYLNIKIIIQIRLTLYDIYFLCI